MKQARVLNQLERTMIKIGKRIEKDEGDVTSTFLQAYSQLIRQWVALQGSKGQVKSFDPGPDFEKGDPEAYGKMERRLIEAEKNFDR